jgi:DNA-binding NarL/FixJ family response regulator
MVNGWTEGALNYLAAQGTDEFGGDGTQETQDETSGDGDDKGPEGIETILLLEDNPGDSVLIQRLLLCAQPDISVTRVESLAAALRCLSRRKYGAALLDLGLPDAKGIEVVESVSRAAPSMPLVVFTGQHEDALAARCLRSGAHSYAHKDGLKSQILMRSIIQALKSKDLGLHAPAAQVAKALAEATEMAEVLCSNQRRGPHRHRSS